MLTKAAKEGRKYRHPFILEHEEVNSDRLMRHMNSQAILRNLFHHFSWNFCQPRYAEGKAQWQIAKDGLIQHEYITPNGNFLTEKGFQYISDHAKEFQAYAI